MKKGIKRLKIKEKKDYSFKKVIIWYNKGKEESICIFPYIIKVIIHYYLVY